MRSCHGLVVPSLTRSMSRGSLTQIIFSSLTPPQLKFSPLHILGALLQSGKGKMQRWVLPPSGSRIEDRSSLASR